MHKSNTVAPVKVAVVMPLAEQRGGGELMLWHLLQEGRDLGIHWLIVFLEEGPMVAQVSGLGIQTELINAGRLREVPRFLSTVRRIAGIVQTEGVDVVLGWMGHAHLYGGLAASAARVPALWYQLGVPSNKHWWDRIATMLPARGILACSIAGAQAQTRLRPRRPVRVVYPGVELDRFDPTALPSPSEARLRLGLPAQGPLIGIVGRLQRWKGMHVLVEALPAILRSHPGAHCIIVGGKHELEPEYPAYLEGRIEALGLADRVILTGLVRNVPEWMQAMEVVVHASDHEPFGIVLVEAMALGKPVVATNSGGPTEIITPELNGLLYPYGNAAALAVAVLRYLDHPAFASRIGAAAQARAQEFSTHRYASTLVAAMRDLVPGSHGQASPLAAEA